MMDWLYYLMGLGYVPPGMVAAKHGIAFQERRVLEKYPQQNTMDAEDWVGAVFVGGVAFMMWPLLALGRLLKRPFKLAWRPTRQYLTPPAQAKWEGHVRDLNAQKALIVSTVKTLNEVREWKPDDDIVRTTMLKDLRDQVDEQMAQLMRMCDSTNSHDGDYLQSVKFDVRKELTG